MSDVIEAHWPAPKTIRAVTTTLSPGYSQGAYASNNLGLHVEDCPEHVICNREQVKSMLALPGEPAWLQQTHTADVVIVEDDPRRNVDASITRSKTTPLVILTADCLPIVLCNQEGTEIAAVHAGWRGLFHGIIQHTLQKMNAPSHTLMAWIGPAICKNCYETSLEIKTQFLEKYPYLAHTFSHRHADLSLMAEEILKQHGVRQVYPSHVCTFEEKNRCYSYRRSAQTGRIGTFIWFRDAL